MLGPHAEKVKELVPEYANSMSRLIGLFTCLPNPFIESYAELKTFQEAVDAVDPDDEKLFSEDGQYHARDPRKPISSTVYLSTESGERWKQHLNRTPRHLICKERVKKRMARQFMEAKYRKICLHCWFPLTCCICEDFILKHHADVYPVMVHGNEHIKRTTELTSSGRLKVLVTFIFHPDELMRQSNTAHIAAMTMNSEILVAGFVNDDAALDSIGIDQNIHVSQIRYDVIPILSEADRRKRRNRALKDKKIRRAKEKENTNTLYDDYSPHVSEPTPLCDSLKSTPSEMNECMLKIEKMQTKTLKILLYPEVRASVSVNKVVSALQTYSEECGNKVIIYRPPGVSYLTGGTPDISDSRLYTRECKNNNANIDDNSTSTVGPDAPVVDTVHVYLSDGTWSQARVVNRRIPRSVPRVSLPISSDYHGLFHALRKKTREDGVSTLEATTIVVGQLLRCAHVDVDTAISSTILKLEASMETLMQKFVDIAALHSNKVGYQCVALSNDEVDTVISRRNQYRVYVQKWEEKGRAEVFAKSINVKLLLDSNTKESQSPLKTDTNDVLNENPSDVSLSLDNDINTNWALITQHLQTNELSHLFPAPVTCYCYVCDAFIGFGSRMIQHVIGVQHSNRLKQTGNYRFEPSEISKTYKNFKAAKYWQVHDELTE